jgi:hypothetical protein
VWYQRLWKNTFIVGLSVPCTFTLKAFINNWKNAI